MHRIIFKNKKEENKMYKAYKKVEIPETGEIVGTGWLPPLPDFRDYTEEHPEIAPMAKKLDISPTKKPKELLPKEIDLRKWFSPIQNQGKLPSCSAHAGTAIVEYFENRTSGSNIQGSRLFLYKTSRNLMGVTGETDVWLRTVMGALVLCGVPPERYWPYTDVTPDFDKEPPAFVYSVASNYEAIRYFCHGTLGMNIPPATILDRVKKWLAAGIPSMFGFYLFSSFNQSDVKGGIPYPCSKDESHTGHALVAAGYSDDMKIRNLKCGKETTGAFLIRNSWGEQWGNQGYGWLPYDYVLNSLATDFWSILAMKWVDTNKFGNFPGVSDGQIDPLW